MKYLILSTDYEGIYDALWKVDELPTSDGSNMKLAAPKPDVTIGFNCQFLRWSRAIDFLASTATLVICKLKLAFLIFMLDVKGLGSTIYSIL